MTTISDVHMTPDEFRRAGHAVVDWIARYMEQVEDYPVLAQVEPGAIRARLPEAAHRSIPSCSQAYVFTFFLPSAP